jgi:hypothetical protein
VLQRLGSIVIHGADVVILVYFLAWQRCRSSATTARFKLNKDFGNILVVRR